MRLINMKVIHRSDLSALTYRGFELLFIQMSIFMHSRPPKQLSHLPPVASIEALVQMFSTATQKRKESLILFEDPDASAIGDRELVKELNKIIETRPDYPLPEGYRRVSQREIIYKYLIPQEWGLEEDKHICLELLDEICNNIIGFHFIEPMIEYKNLTKVQPQIMKPKKSSIPLRYMEAIQKKPRKKSQLQPMVKSKSAYYEEKLIQSPPQRKIIERKHHIISGRLKLLVAETRKEERSKAEEIAELLEEICSAVSKGREHLESRQGYGQGGKENLGQLERKEDEEEIRLSQIKKEEDRKKRHTKLKKEVKKNEEIKKELKTKQIAEEKKKKVIEARREQKKKESYEKIKQEQAEKVQNSKTETLEEEEKKREKDAKKLKDAEELKNKKHKEFVIKSRNDLVSYFHHYIFI